MFKMSSSGEKVLSCADNSDKSESAVTSEIHSATDLPDSLMSPLNHSKGFKLRLLAVKLLTMLWCLWNDDNGVGNCEIVYKFVGRFLNTEDLDLSQLSDVHLVVSVCETLCSSSELLSLEMINLILEALRSVLAQQYLDQQIAVSVLDVLAKLAKHFQYPAEVLKVSNVGDTCNRVLEAFCSLLAAGKLASHTRISLVRVFKNFIKVDHKGQWTSVLQKKKSSEECNGMKITLHEVLIGLLADENHAVRMEASKIDVLFTREKREPCFVSVEPLHRSLQERMFSAVCESVKTLYSPPAEVDIALKEDDTQNRTASVLYAFVRVALCSPVCRKMALFQLFNYNQLDSIEITEKALRLLSSCLGYSTSKEFLEVHLEFLLYSWLGAKQTLSSYPFKFHGFSCRADFFHCYGKIAIPYALFYLDSQQPELIGGDLHCDWVELVKTSLSHCMTFILPAVAMQRSNAVETTSNEEREAVKLEQTRSRMMYHLLQNKMDILKILRNEIDSFVVELLLRMHEPCSGHSVYAKYASVSDPEPNPPYYTSHCIKTVLDYLVERYEEFASLVDLLAFRRDTIHCVLLSLKSILFKSQNYYEKKRVLMAYALFVDLMAAQIHTGLGGSRTYFFRDVVGTVVELLKHMHSSKQKETNCLAVWEKFMSLCCQILFVVCTAALGNCSQVLGSHLHIIVSCLTEIAARQQPAAQEALALLNVLIKNNYSRLKNFIASLDPFPDLELFNSLQRVYRQAQQEKGLLTLEKNVTRFMSVDRHCPAEARLEGLQSLKLQLKESTKEIGQLNPTTVRKLICHLIWLASFTVKVTSEQSCMVVSEVAACLGELGAIDIGSISLSTQIDEEENQPYHEAMLSFRIVSAGIRPCKLLHKLNALLTDDSVATAAASCLKSILATKYGSEFLVEYEEHGIDDLHEYLYPFKCEQEEELNNPVVTSCEEVFVRHVDQSDLWWPPGASGQRTHNQWVQDVTAAFLQSNGVTDPMLVLLQPACHAKVSFAEFLFPHLIHNILQSKNPVYCNVLSSQIQGFFSRLRSLKETTTDNDVSPHLITTVARESIKLLLNTINFLRTKDKKENSNSWENNFWLELNYLSLAEAAQMCSAYFMSLLYLEIWQDAKKSSRIAYFSTPQSSLTSPLLDVASSAEGLFRQDSLLMGSHHSVLLEAYSKIGEPDALQGAAVVCSEDASARLKIYEEEGQWTRALGSYDLQLQDCASGCKASVVESLKHLGLNHVAFTYMDGLWNTDPIEAAKMSEHQYEMAWRNCVWNLDIESRSVSSSTGYHHAVHSCLHALSNSEFGPFQSSLNQALKIVISDLAAASLESILGIYPMLARLQCLVEMKEICNVMKRNSSYDGVSSQWQHRLQLTQDHFVHVEPVLALRTSLLQIAVNRCHQLGASSGQSESLMTILVNHLQSQAEVASQASCHQVSQQALAKLKLLCNQLSSESTALNYQCRMKEAELFWLRGEEKVALRAIASLHNDLEKMQGDNDAVNALYPNVLLLHGNWLAESHSERPTIVVDKYLQPAANLLSQLEDNSQTESSLMKAYFSLARYGDQRYRKIADYMQSSDFEIKKELMQQQKEEFENLQLQRGTVSLPGSQQYWKRRNNTLRRQIEIDENEIKSLHEDSKSFALKSLKNYSLCMQTGDDYDLHVFRFCSLWMENSHQQDVCQLVQKEMNKLQSRKFIPLLYQLAARLTFNRQTNITSEFQATLSMLIKRMCLDHPHHCVLALMALTLADKDAEYSMSSNIRPSAKRPRLMKEKTDRDEYVIDEDKIRAAKEILATLRSQRASQIQDMEHLAHFYISLAYHITESQRFTRGAVKKVPSHLQKRISGLKEVAVPTVELMVDPTCRYDNIICVNNFEPSFTEAGGVNHPKIVTCIGSDGRRRRQLVKGKDDLRQDAVMQQVFALVNKLLQKKAATRKRKLTIRTYKVIPLSQRSGVVEWCEGTVPLGIYLVGEGTDNSKGAHRKYEPNDWTSHKCRIKLSEAANKDRAIKLKSYMTITEHFHPVFRHFFRESFPDPAIWFERRLAYTRSLAAASIVGYIVGLGDRHPQNILIDRNTAEVIHIDFGVAFEQGRALPTPETVPFRLTRDLVDGMGVTGVEGIFRRACEETLIVMRGNVEAVLTILEVLLHDPLYDWSMNPVKALNLQENSESTDDASMAALAGDISHPSSASANVRTASVTSGQVSSKTNNKMAVRVLLRLRQKLEGVENSVPMSVAGQVNHLIQEAVDPENLCRVYSGWQPWI
ncbi:serine-protein kinase ATM-like isoform X2 [Corticium candelabrum]|uniref:serine-protein kinase ATM-like isoform X2 n=1 Tax=Corticium candelabrum TaxID=121492 RepID=UPI002E2633E9|nr:serine-protein kinase ATM-like isoform X2 [Corticium candelabrum]